MSTRSLTCALLFFGFVCLGPGIPCGDSGGSAHGGDGKTGEPADPDVTKDEDGRVVQIVLGSASTDKDLAQIGSFESLRRLNATDSEVTDTGLRHLRELSGLEELWLRDTRVTDRGVAHVGTLTGLNKLSLASTTVTDAGLPHLKTLTNLTHLYLDNTSVTAGGLKASGLLGHLKVLSVGSTRISIAERRELRKEYPGLTLFPIDGLSYSADVVPRPSHGAAIDTEHRPPPPFSLWPLVDTGDPEPAIKPELPAGMTIDPSLGVTILAETEGDFEVVARLEDRRGDRFNRPFRSAVLHIPWVYVLDREGGLHLFRLPDRFWVEPILRFAHAASPYVPIPNEFLRWLVTENYDRVELTRCEEKVGDGNDLAIVGDVLFCTHHGDLEVFSLKVPRKPERLGRFGPGDRWNQSQTIIAHAGHLFLIGAGGLLVYDVSEPSKPRYLGITRMRGGSSTGCAIGKYLYVHVVSPLGNTPMGIAVIDISAPAKPKKVGFVATYREPFHLHPIGDNRLVASMEGYAQLFDLSEPRHPKSLGETRIEGGRATTVLRSAGHDYLVCDGEILRHASPGLESCFSFRDDGTRYGLPYHGDSQYPFAVIATGGAVVVVGHKGLTVAIRSAFDSCRTAIGRVRRVCLSLHPSLKRFSDDSKSISVLERLRSDVKRD